MCVTLLYFGSLGDVVRKSELTASTLLQCALESIVFRVPNRLRSLSNANSYRKNTGQNNGRVLERKHEYLSLVLHNCAEVGCLVSRRGRRVDYDGIISGWRGEDVCWKAGCLVLEYDLPGQVERVLREAYTRMKGE